MENKKNTILLTVIAVATLLVAVVGATFAYFTAQGGATSDPVNVTITTGTAASTTFTVGSDISLTADMSNFAEVTGETQSGTSTSYVAYTSPSVWEDGEDSSSFCYTVGLTVTENTFTHTISASDPELVLTVTKTDYTGASTTIYDQLDITTAAASGQTYYMPTTASSAALTTTTTNSIHTITASTNSTDYTDTWVFKVEFLWYENNDQTANAGNGFTGKFVFTKATCA